MGIFNKKKHWLFWNWRGYPIGVVLVALATWLKYLAQPNVIPAGVPILYIAAIVPTAIFFGLGPSLMVCILSLVAFDYFFMAPIHSFSFTNIGNVPIIGIFFLVGIILSLLTSNLRHKTDEANQKTAALEKSQIDLKKHRASLEEQVQQRTQELEKANLVLRDEIRGRQQTEEKLRQSEQQFRSMFESHHAVMLLIDPASGQIVDANPAAVVFYGYSRAALAGMSITRINQLQPEQARLSLNRAVNKETNQFTFPHRLASGEIRTVEVFSSPVNILNRPILFSIIHDVTERQTAEEKLKRSEELYRSLFKNMLNGFAYCQMLAEEGRPLDFIYLAVNDSFERLTGLKNVQGKRVSEVIPGIQTSDPGLLNIYRRVASGGPPEQFESYLEALQMWFSISVYCPQEGYFVALFDVITERKKAEENLKEEIHIRAQFIDILAHELRSPLSPILNSSAMLKDLLAVNPDDKLKRLSANAYASTLILSSRLDELLELARYSRGSFSLNTESTDIAKFIEAVANRYRPSIEQSQHQMSVIISPNLPALEIDQSRIEQVIVNLLSNAAKYSPPGTLIALSVAVESGVLRIDVKDQGQGLSESDQKSLFQPYHRLKQNRQNSPGLGLGLSICKQIVEAHHGKIEVISQLGQGSLFRVSLPADQH
jgi:PAS domain S-box-containing protein